MITNAGRAGFASSKASVYQAQFTNSSKAYESGYDNQFGLCLDSYAQMTGNKQPKSFSNTLASQSTKSKGPNSKTNLSHKDSDFRIRKSSTRAKRAHSKQVKHALASVYSAAPSNSRVNPSYRDGRLPELH